jgi:hypothetical protein
MKKHFSLSLLFIFCLFIPSSCKTEDIDPDLLSNEIKVSCILTDSGLADYLDTTSSKEVWTSCVITNGCNDRQFNSYGLCWSYNADILPTIKSEKNDVSWADAQKSDFRETNQGVHLYYFYPVNTGIPVSESDSKLIVRGFVIFNDTLVRYSEPLVIVNPVNYAI